MRQLAITGLFVAAVLFFPAPVAAQTWTHPWLSSPDNRSDWFKANVFLPNTEWSEVLRERNVEAAEQLQNASFVEISRERARELTGLRLLEAKAPRLFLLRGVEFGEGGSVFRIYQLEGEVWVTSGILSSRDLPLRSSPVVVSLVEAPRKVYVSASIAQ